MDLNYILEENAMFTAENFKSLVGIKDRNELMRAISQMTEEDLRTALTLAILSWNKSEQINSELWKREFDRANEAEAQLKNMSKGC